VDLTYTEIDHEDTPIGRLTLRAYRAETGESGHEILIDGAFLMASHGSHSERAMADLAHRRLPAGSTGLSVLVGGLGAGHTLRAALDLPGIERVEVVEIGRKVVDWNRTYFSETNGHAVDDPRVRIVHGHVLDVLQSAEAAYELVLLDVDNGPGWLAADSNRPLYGPLGLAACRRALRAGGVLALWSPRANLELESTLTAVFDGWIAEDTGRIGRAVGEPPSVIYLASTGAGKN